jgi:hypothetical protein
MRPSVPTETILVDMSSTNITTSFVQLKAALTSTCSHAEIINPSATPIQLGVGGSGAESAVPAWHPQNTGARGIIPLRLDAGARLTAKSQTGTIAAGILIINLFA